MKSESPYQIKQQIRELCPENPALFGSASYSQFDEDGIIRECLRRISTQATLTHTCVEIGCGDGLENNTHQLLLEGFSSVWVDGSQRNIEFIYQQLGSGIFPDLLILEEMVNRQNALAIAADAANFLGVESVDFFSLDIDGNDIHVCDRFISALNPKLVCVEYNAKFPPPISLAMNYDESHAWNNDDYFGVSLQAWINFFHKFSYSLVSCNLSGANAFFVKNELMQPFAAYSADLLYQPARYELIAFSKGHPASLSWLRQRLQIRQIPESDNRSNRRPCAIAKTTYGSMSVYSDDQVIGRSLLESGSFQEHKISDVLELLKSKYQFEPGVFIDIGANIGTHSIYALKNNLVDKVVAFEPDFENARLLRKNIAINRLSSKFDLHIVAISDKAGILELEISQTNYGDHRIKPKDPSPVSFGEEDERTIRKIESVSLDSLDADLKMDWSNALVWMDTQGHEGYIFDGGKKFLNSKRGPRFILSEFWPYGIERSQSRLKYFQYLQNCEAIYDVNSADYKDGKGVCIDDLSLMYDQMLKTTEKEYHPHTDLLIVTRSIF